MAGITEQAGVAVTCFRNRWLQGSPAWLGHTREEGLRQAIDQSEQRLLRSLNATDVLPHVPDACDNLLLGVAEALPSPTQFLVDRRAKKGA